MFCSWASILIHTSFLRLRLFFFFFLCMLALISVFYFVLLSEGQKHLHSSMLVITPVCSVQFSSVTQSCLTFCDPMDCSTPGLPVHHQIPNSCSLRQRCHPTISSSPVPFFSHLQSFPASGCLQMSSLFTSGGQSIGVSASTSVLPTNTQDWSCPTLCDHVDCSPPDSSLLEIFQSRILEWIAIS